MIKAAPDTASLDQARYVRNDLAAAEEQRAKLARQTCDNCGKVGHKRKDCNEKRKATSETECNNCHEYGHFAADCPNAEVFTGHCYHCNETGHRKSSFPKRLCRNCSQPGHTAGNCPNKTCSQYRQEGYVKKECPEVAHHFTLPSVPSNFNEFQAAKEHPLPEAENNDELDPWGAQKSGNQDVNVDVGIKGQQTEASGINGDKDEGDPFDPHNSANQGVNVFLDIEG